MGRAVVSVASQFVWSCDWVRVHGDPGEGSAAGLSGFLASRVPGALNSATCARDCQAFLGSRVLGDFCQGPGAGPLRPSWGHVYLVTCVRDMVPTCLLAVYYGPCCGLFGLPVRVVLLRAVLLTGSKDLLGPVVSGSPSLVRGGPGAVAGYGRPPWPHSLRRYRPPTLR